VIESKGVTSEAYKKLFKKEQSEIKLASTFKEIARKSRISMLSRPTLQNF